MTEEGKAAVMKHLRDVISHSEFEELVNRCRSAAAEQGRWFVLDEATLLMGERIYATYLRRLAQSVGMDELVTRLDPGQFPPGAYEQLLNEGRASNSAAITTTH